MTDRVYPSAKPKTTTTTTTRSPKPRLPPPPNKTKPNNYTTKTTNSHPYRPNPTTNNHTRPRSRRGRVCLCCFWSILIIILLLLIATVAGCILYLLYRPHRPTFSIAALKIHEFHVTTNDDTTKLSSKLNITISSKNPNKKITFYYDPFAITCLSDETVIAKGSFLHSLVTPPNNITIIRSSLSSKSMLMETQSVNEIKSHLKKKSGLPLKIFLDTQVRVKVESIRTKKIGIRVICQGIHTLVPKSNTGKSRNSTSSYVTANVSGVKCKFDLRIKIWKWTF